MKMLHNLTANVTKCIDVYEPEHVCRAALRISIDSKISVEWLAQSIQYFTRMYFNITFIIMMVRILTVN